MKNNYAVFFTSSIWETRRVRVVFFLLLLPPSPPLPMMRIDIILHYVCSIVAGHLWFHISFFSFISQFMDCVCVYYFNNYMEWINNLLSIYCMIMHTLKLMSKTISGYSVCSAFVVEKTIAFLLHIITFIVKFTHCFDVSSFSLFGMLLLLIELTCMTHV